jgi:hypothetical protein
VKDDQHVIPLFGRPHSVFPDCWCSPQVDDGVPHSSGARVWIHHTEENVMETKIRDEFAVHMLNQLGKDRAADIAKQFTVCLNNLEAIIGADGREMAIVRTKLQEAAFFAKRAMAVRSENQES